MKEACANSGIPTSECFSHVGKTSPMPTVGSKISFPEDQEVQYWEEMLEKARESYY